MNELYIVHSMRYKLLMLVDCTLRAEAALEAYASVLMNSISLLRLSSRE